MFHNIRIKMQTPALLLAGVLALALPMCSAAAATVLLGAHVGNTGDPDAQAQFTALETALGRKLAIDNDQEGWFENSAKVGFPNVPRVQWDIKNGRIPMLSWMVSSKAPRTRTGPCASAEDIMSGRYDDQIARQARTVRDFHTTIMIRFNFELSSKTADCFYGGRDHSDRNGAEVGNLYVQSWRHIVDIFRKQGANNVQWVWAPGIRSYALEDGRVNDRWKTSYPGAAYVDWIAVDHYNKSGHPESFGDDQQFQIFYSETASLGKPLMMAETGADSDPAQNPDPQTVWLSTMRTTLAQRYPAVKAILYWDVPGSSHKRDTPGFQGGYALTGPGLAAFKAMANDPYFQAKDASPYSRR